MNKNITYNLNEDNLRGVFAHYEVGFDETHWADAERHLDSLGLQKKNSITFKARKLVLFCCLIVLGGGLVAFINYNSRHKVSQQLAGTDESNNAVTAMQAAGETDAMKVDSEVPQLLMSRKAIAVIMPSADTARVQEAPVTVADGNSRNENKVTGEQKTTDIVQQSEKKEITVTDSQETKKKKKKRKKRRHADNSENPAPVTHAASDDDVIIE